MIVYKKVNLTGLVLGPIFFLLIFLLIPESVLEKASTIVVLQEEKTINAQKNATKI